MALELTHSRCTTHAVVTRRSFFSRRNLDLQDLRQQAAPTLPITTTTITTITTLLMVEQGCTLFRQQLALDPERLEQLETFL